MGDRRWSRGRVLLLGALLVGGVAGAQEAVSTSAGPGHDLFQARVRYGVALRSGTQRENGPNLSYGGLTPNDVGFAGWGWFLLDGHLGLFGSVQREAFALYTGASRVTGGGLLRASAGPTGRISFGPVTLEAAVGYAFHQLPAFGSAADPVFSTAQRHGVLLAGRGLVDIGPVTVEARGEAPIALSTTDGSGNAARASGFAVGGGVRIQLFRTGTLMWGALADVSYVSDNLATTGGPTAAQSMIRAGAALDLKWQEEPPGPAPRFGELEVQVVDADTGVALPGATVQIGERNLPASPTGVARLGELVAGAVTARATAGGYLPGEGQGAVVPGSTVSLLLRLKKEPAKVGALAISVLGKETKAPLANAKVTVGELTASTNAQGLARFEELKPGPIGIKVLADGYSPGEEAANVIAGQTSELAIALVEVKKRVPATITGLVRSTQGGRPITADLAIVQAKLKTRANATGAFTFRLEGGTYTINISAPGYLSQSKVVTVKDGDQAIFNVDLHPK